MRSRSYVLLAAIVAASVAVGINCGGSDTSTSSNTGGNGGSSGTKSTGTRMSSTGTNGTGGSGAGTNTGPGTGGSTSTNSGGAGGMIDPGSLDCSPPSGTLPALKLTTFVSGLDHPVDFKPAPGDASRIFIVEQTGQVRLIKNGTLVDAPFLPLANLVDYDGAERGLLSIAFHPDYHQNGRFFVYYSNKADDHMHVAEYHADPSSDVADTTPVQTILDYPDSESNHNGGTLTFGPKDHKLYISWGDGGNGNDAHSGVNDYSACGNGQFLQTMLGKIHRLDVDHPSGGKAYTPAGANIAGALPEIFDYGLRNPWRLSFDGCTGDLFIGDVGQNTHEEVDREPAVNGQVPGGKNYGWRCYEGAEACPTCDNTGCPCDPTNFTMPLVSLDRSIAQTVIGGYVYRGSAIPALRGMYLFSDAGDHKVWILDPASNYAFQADGQGNDNFGGNTLSQPVSFGQDDHGEVYVVDRTGEVFRVDAM
ncbi:MAG TPA: PQQ-dependent sugar dehydrogenase [Minicystis sp.]|nr:PQQ-dependent sugar dehydrogenase [Minicystis sp.]